MDSNFVGFEDKQILNKDHITMVTALYSYRDSEKNYILEFKILFINGERKTYNISIEPTYETVKKKFLWLIPYKSKVLNLLTIEKACTIGDGVLIKKGYDRLLKELNPKVIVIEES